MARNYAAVPHEYLDEMEELDDAAFGRLIRSLLEYSRDGIAIESAGDERFFARRVMAQEDRFQQSYAESSNKRSEAGKKGAAKRWKRQDDSNAIDPMANDSNAIKNIAMPFLPMANDSKNGNTETKTKTNTNISSTIVERDNARARERKFFPPTVEEVRAYCDERGNRVDPEQFVDFYTAKGWKIGNQTMKNWKAAVRTWEKRENIGGSDSVHKERKWKVPGAVDL